MKNKKPSAADSDAIFIGWQEKVTGDFFPIYIVTAEGHPLCGSSVSEKFLNEQNLRFSKQQHPDKRENSPDRPERSQALLRQLKNIQFPSSPEITIVCKEEVIKAF